MTAEQRGLQAGDHVRVRRGVRDPDFEDLDLGGWTGRVTVVGKNRGAKTHVTVTWDRKTRLAVPIAIMARCAEEGLRTQEMDLTQAELERIEPPETLAPGSLEDLLEQMQDEGDWPSPDILVGILSKGNEVVEPLREVVRRGCADPDAAGCADVAAGLLGELKAQAAVPELLRLLREGDEDALEWTPDALVAIGEIPPAALKDIIRDQHLDSARRVMAVHVYEGMAIAQPEHRSALIALLTDILTDVARFQADLSINDAELVGAMVTALSSCPGPEARAGIDAAFEAGIVQPWAIEPSDAASLCREGAERRPLPLISFLEAYRERHAESMEDDRWADPDDDHDGDGDDWEPDDDEPSGMDDEGDEEVVEAPIIRPKVGRNDPCPCGSGKKYKKCCIDKPAITAGTVAAALVSKLATRTWSVDFELPAAVPLKPGTIETHADVPKDLRQRLERARLESLVLMRSLDHLNVYPTERDFPPALRALFELDADCAEALWGLDQRLGKFKIHLMLQDTMRALDALPAARSKVLALLEDDVFAELQEIGEEIAATVGAQESYNMVKGRDPDAVGPD